MGIKPTFGVNAVVSNNELTKEFKCANMGGMRRSKQTNTLVIVSDHTKGLYEDKWINDVLHYTGMGKTGDQRLAGNQNITLFESPANGVEVHLFEVFKSGEYTYRGIVNLAGTPFIEKQNGDDGISRQVWMFPLKLIDNEHVIDATVLEAQITQKKKQAKRMNNQDLESRAMQNQSIHASYRSATTTFYYRDPFVSENAKRKANGKCQLCAEKAPFHDKDGTPYLETHHIKWLSEGGGDTIDNTAALCPNCHRKMHVVNDPSDVTKLKKIISK